MDSHNNIQDTIKQYLEGNMTVQEKKDFDNQMKNSEELAEEVRRFRQLRIFDKNKNLISANTQLSAVMADIHIEPDYGTYEKYFKKSFFDNLVWQWLLCGLAVVALISGIFFYQINQDTQALMNLSKTYLQPMENIIGFAADDQTQAAKAMLAYDSKNYDEAIRLLNYAIKTNSDDNTLRLYLAISYLMQEQNIQSEILLQEISKTNDLTTIPAKWYLALSFLQSGQKAKARTLLQSLRSDTTFGNRAKEILKSF